MDWLTREVITGLQKLLCLGLNHTPATDLIKGTAMTWADGLSEGRLWDEDRDTARIRQAFTALSIRCRQWPAPAEFLECLPVLRDQFVSIPHTKASDPERVSRLIAEAAETLGVPRS